MRYKITFVWDAGETSISRWTKETLEQEVRDAFCFQDLENLKVEEEEG